MAFVPPVHADGAKLGGALWRTDRFRLIRPPGTRPFRNPEAERDQRCFDAVVETNREKRKHPDEQYALQKQWIRLALNESQPKREIVQKIDSVRVASDLTALSSDDVLGHFAKETGATADRKANNPSDLNP